jgi:diaminohydroxyphosphoribosylaminopyrimidine deaminase/5-amino-6-(5-phosphoribosylamino)uracil reductase
VPEAEADVPDAAAVSLAACRRVNEALLHRVATGQPFSVWKYAMTLDGKIATRSGHSAWVSG